VKRTLVLAIGILILMSVVAVVTVSAEISGSSHDFSAYVANWNPRGEVCIVCHTPHNANNTVAPLWNHAVTTATFTLYSSPSLNATIEQPSASSKACLSCHDGTVAPDSVGGHTGTEHGLSGRHLIGTDLTNDHPISFTYDKTLAAADGSLHDPTVKTVASLGGKTIDASMLINHKLECGSCHDVHADKGDAVVMNYLLVVDNHGSALCLTCHNK